MKLYFLCFLIAVLFEIGGTFFLLEAKAIYFCLKVCPLYCSKRNKRDAEPPYWDEDYDEDVYIPYRSSYLHDRSYDDPPLYHRHHPRFYHCDKTTTTTISTTTTEKPKPSGICEFCNKKCGTPLAK